MRFALQAGILSAFLAGCVSCAPQPKAPEAFMSSVTLDGAVFEIADAAISSNCLSLVFSVRGFSPPPGSPPQYGVPPAKSIAIRAGIPELLSDPIPLGGGGGGGGNDEDGRVWMRQEMTYSLAAPVAPDTEVPLEITVLLNDDFRRPEPLEYRVPVVAGPGGGLCPQPEPSS
jgi:hypothetical protein